ncbi:inositol monophosphatase family protein [Shigella flexneri]
MKYYSKSYPPHHHHRASCGPVTDQDVEWAYHSLDGTTNFITSAALRADLSPFVSRPHPSRCGIRSDASTVHRHSRSGRQPTATVCAAAPLAIDGTILATGFPFKAKQYAMTYINIVGKLFNECADFRRTGSALDLAYVAAGRVDGFFEIGLRPWDFAGGEAAGRERAASSATSPVVITTC